MGGMGEMRIKECTCDDKDQVMYGIAESVYHTCRANVTLCAM